MSGLSTNQIRISAAAFSEKFKDAKYEIGETQTFYNEFFEIFGIQRRQVALYERKVQKLKGKTGRIDLFWPRVLIVEQKSVNKSLVTAEEQALAYLEFIPADELPRYVLSSDFQTFRLTDLESDVIEEFSLSELKNKIELFNFMRGLKKRKQEEDLPLNIKASVLMGRLHDELYDSGYRGHDLERFLVRLLFCLFADDTGIFEPRDIFHDYILNQTREDGSDTGSQISMLFQVLNTPIDSRLKLLDEDLQRFDYINGDLFAEKLEMPSFDSKMRNILLQACEFDWGAISPAIFGALFQHVSGDAKARRERGEHYTSEEHIMRVIGPLFLDELKEELSVILAFKGKKRKSALTAYSMKLSGLTFFDPACGCGNFLIIAYREIRKLWQVALQELYKDHGEDFFGLTLAEQVTVNQFFGVEINEFPSRIAEVALWMMDHIMNQELSLALRQDCRRIPIRDKPKIVHGDALELDWNEVIDVSKCNYILGNPPFVGAKVQTEFQRLQVNRIANLGKGGGTLDFVAAWFIKAGEYARGHSTRIAFVCTNSVTQGEQVAQIWPLLFQRFGLDIIFAHRSFNWLSEAIGRAHVHVVIIGLQWKPDSNMLRALYEYDDIHGEPVKVSCRRISPYLIDGSGLRDHTLTVKKSQSPVNGLPNAKCGLQPIDNGEYIFTPDERVQFVEKEPFSESFFLPFVGAKEFISGETRFLLAVHAIEPQVLRSMPYVRERVERVRDFRRKSKRALTRDLANFPTKYQVHTVPLVPFIVLPETSSERREYVPFAIMHPPVVPSNSLSIVESEDIWIFALLTSRMHMAWLKVIGGRLKSDVRYSIGVVYNTFPVAQMTETTKERLSALGQGIIEARNKFPSSNLDDLYDPVAMPSVLRSAHQELDRYVDRLYRRQAFGSDIERAEHLLGLYEQMVTPLFIGGKSKHRRQRKG